VGILMALQKDAISVDLTMGRDAGTDEKFVEGNLEVINCVPDKAGRLAKRRGTRFGQSLGGFATDPPKLNGTIDTVLASGLSGTTYTSKARTNSVWNTVSGGVVASTRITPVATQIADSTGTRNNGDIALSSSGSLMMGLEEYNIDNNILLGGSPIIDPVASFTPSEYRALTVNGRVILLYAQGTAAYIEYAYLAEGRVDSALGTSIGTETSLISVKSDSVRQWDACVVGTNIVVTYINRGADGYYVISNVYSESGGVLSLVGSSTTIWAFAADNGSMISCFPLSATTVGILWTSDSTEDLYGAVQTVSTQAILVSATVLIASSGSGYEYTAAACNGGFNLYRILPTTGTLTIDLITSDLSTRTNLSTKAFGTGGHYLASKALPSTNSYESYETVVLFRSDPQKKFMLISSKHLAVVLSGFEYPDAIGTPLNGLLRSLVLVSDYNILGLIFQRNDTSTANQYVHTTYKFDLTPRAVPQCVSAGSLVLAAPMIKVVNTGVNPVSLERPVLGSATKTNGSGTLANGTYLYRAIWEFYDSEGRVYRSPVSEAVRVITEAAEDTVSFTPIPPNSFALASHYANTNLKVQLKLYRTLASGTNYFHVASSEMLLLGSLSMSAVTDTTPDTAIETTAQGYPLLYTEGSVFENSVPHAMLHITSHQNRVFGISQELSNQIWFSKQREVGVGLEFSELLTIAIAAEEKLTALASLNNTLVVFSKSGIWALAGEGPNNTGEGVFSAPQLISNRVGCVDWRSVAEFPGGILFNSLKGWHILDGGLNVTYVGNAVQDRENGTTLQVSTDYSASWIHVLDDTGVLIFNYETGRWFTTDTDQTVYGLIADGTANDKGGVWYAHEGMVVRPHETAYTEVNSASEATDYFMTIKTPWLKPGGAAGFQRLYSIEILGEFKSNHSLQVNVYYDYNDTTPAETKTLAITSSNSTPYLFRFQPAKQKCTSIRFDIIEASTSGTKESFTISGLRANIGIKDKTPVPSSRNF
jgi:hypothetical protein